ncbi:MAG TPA: class F sortase [Phototrophicaceae bacterium]|jgi:LPXTG-site transpeptidase (sortase) family protein|nr:class F sortase [Phototrophicaceae bacterium]
MAGMIYLVYDQINSPSIQTLQITEVIEPTTTIDSTTASSVSLTSPLAPIATAGLAAEAELFIPEIGVSAAIIPVFLDGESWNVSQLGMNVGYLQGTAWLDQPGNVVLSGHVELRDGRPGIFRELRDLSVGDQIIIVYQGSERTYQVSESLTVNPDDLTPLYPTETDRLTLITCDAYDFFQDSYQKRAVIVAERVS